MLRHIEIEVDARIYWRSRFKVYRQVVGGVSNSVYNDTCTLSEQFATNKGYRHIRRQVDVAVREVKDA
jgi:hypothetical protein